LRVGGAGDRALSRIMEYACPAKIIPFGFVMTPLERNGRKLIGVLVQYFPTGCICEDLRRQFERDTGLARQSFYNALKYAKEQSWIVGGGKDPRDQYQLYTLNPNGSWKEPLPSTGEVLEKEALEKDQLEYLVDSKTQQIDELQGDSSAYVSGVTAAMPTE
jgi:hypothetical protein